METLLPHESVKLLCERSEEATSVHNEASSPRIVRRLTTLFPSEFLEEYAEELHLPHNVTEQTIDRFSVADEKTHDSTEFSTGSWLEDRLVLFDQAYFKYRRFTLIDENDGYFVSRLKPNANPETTRELRE